MPLRNLPNLLFVILILLAYSGCAPQPPTPLVVFAAGSLILPFGELEKAFEARHPEIDIQAEYHGSIQVMRHATELHEKIDVVATADQALIPLLMYRPDPDTGQPFATWYLRFATNRLGIACTPTSKYAQEITEDNWMDILTRPDVKAGLADPRFDASGYRALMMVKLAERFYNRPDLFNRMFSGQFRYPVKVDEGGGWAVIRVPEVMESRPEAQVVLRGASVQLLALLESGDLDYAFEYESVIQQHGLKLIRLPDELNLGSAAHNDEYNQVTVLLDFQRFASVKPEFTGEQIGYGLTIPANAPHPRQAEQFTAFIFSPEGREIMKKAYHPVFDQITADNTGQLPEALRGLAVQAP